MSSNEAKRDGNFVTTLMGVSSVDGVTPVTVYVDPVTHRLKVDLSGGGSGTVTSVSVVSANGFAGTVATATSTPAITLTTTITGILQGDGTAISAATTTGTGNIVLSSSPTLVTPALGTPSSVTLTNATGLPLTTGVTGTLPVANGGTGATTASGARTNLNVDVAGTDNSTDVTLSGTGTYLSLTGQDIQVDPITESDISDLGTYSTDIHANITALDAVSGTNTGDETVATGAEVDTGTNDTKMVTPKAIADSGVMSNLSEDTTPQLGGNLDTNAKDINLSEQSTVVLDSAGSADGKYSGIAIDGTAGATLAFGDIVYLAVSDSRWALADASVVATGAGTLGVCILASTSGVATKILLMGTIRADTAFPTLTIGAQVFLSTTAGDVQVLAPTATDEVVRVLGTALTADEMLWNPSQDHLTVV